jgi:hypothetical protein
MPFRDSPETTWVGCSPLSTPWPTTPGTGTFAGSLIGCFGTTTGLFLDNPCSSAAVATAGSSVALTVNALANNASGTSGAT